LADKIGNLELTRITGYSKEGREYALEANLGSESEYQSLEELLRDSEYGTAIHVIPGGPPQGEDLSEARKYTHICSFDDDSLPDAWYLLRGGLERREEGPVFLQVRFELFYLGTQEAYGMFLLVEDVGEVSNDWGI